MAKAKNILVILALLCWGFLLLFSYLFVGKRLEVAVKWADPVVLTPVASVTPVTVSLISPTAPAATPMPTSVPTATPTPIPTATQYVSPTPVTGCYNSPTAKTSIAMHNRRQPHTSSHTAIYIRDTQVLNYVPPGVEVRVYDSVQQDDYCWLFLGAEYSNGWIADTSGVIDPASQRGGFRRIDNCCFVNRECSGDDEWTQGYLDYAADACYEFVTAEVAG